MSGVDNKMAFEAAKEITVAYAQHFKDGNGSYNAKNCAEFFNTLYEAIKPSAEDATKCPVK